ncbi:hypothetical protein ES705_07419 [subsurface metagenome]
MIILSDVIQEVLNSGAILVVDPTIMQTDPDDFLDRYGHSLDTIALVAKSRTGFTFYQSNSAPKDRNSGVFFHSFCTIADNMGIKVDAFIHVHGDNFLSQNTDFRVFNSAGNAIPLYVCPSQENFSKYIATIAQEVSRYPINMLVLDSLMFPTKKACFCDRCRRVFASNKNIERDFSFEFLESRTLLEDWDQYRDSFVTQTLREITDTVKNQKNIDVATIIKADEETGSISGSQESFGQNLSELAKITNKLIIHVNPWRELPNSVDTPEYQQLLSGLSPISEYTASGVQHSLYFWNVRSSEKLAIANRLKEDLRAESVFIETSLPPDYTERRALNLGF